MTDRARAAYFLAALVAVFVLAYFAGAVIGPRLGLDQSRPAEHGTDDHGGSMR
jgi:hypothetical protein